jgi:zinc transport system ATP-binding protein
MNILEVKNLSFGYNSEMILKSLNFSLKRSEYVAIIGENGSGKSTLIRILLGILKPTKGEVRLFSKNIKTFSSWNKIGYIPQNVAKDYSFLPITVREILETGFSKSSSLDFQKQSKFVCELTKITNILDDKLSDLSGGQKQRVFIARSLINNPELLILDEPSANIDPEGRENLFNFLHSINQKYQMTILLITHDLDRIKNEVGRVLCIQKNEIFEPNQKIEHIHN